MNAATITIAVLAFVIIAQRVRMCMYEDYANRLEAMAHQALNQRDRYARRCAHKDATIGDYVRDCDAVTAHMALLEARERVLGATTQPCADALVERAAQQELCNGGMGIERGRRKMMRSALDVLPEFALDNLFYQGNADAKLLRYGGLKDSPLCHFTDLLDLRFVETRFWILYSHRSVVSAFCNHVGNIVCICSQKEMGGINARRIVTFMQNVQAIGNWPIMQNIGKAMCSAFPALIAETAVSLSSTRTRPLPTIIGPALIDLRPKTIFDGAVIFNSHVVTAHKAGWSTLDVPQLGLGHFGNRSKLTAATVTVAVRNFIRGIIEGHKKSPFLCLIRRRVDARWPVLLLPFTPVIIAENGRKHQ